LDGAAKARGAPKLPAAADATREEIQRVDRSFMIEVMILLLKKVSTQTRQASVAEDRKLKG
jgi:hypothetical protein